MRHRPPPADAPALDPIDRILAFFSRFVELDETERRLVRELTRIERYPKRTRLLGEGDVARESWLVIEGCVRVFRRVDGADRTIALHTELHPAIPPTYGSDVPSPVAFECLEDVVASASTPEEVARGLADHPGFERVCRVMGEVLVTRLQEAEVDVRTRTPEQRYLDLRARRPELLQRVAQYHIASFLGIKPETLSRIRHRLARRDAASR